MRLKKQTNKQKFSLLWRQLEMLPHSLHLGLSGSFFWSLSCPPKALWLAWGGALGTGHSLLTLVLQECSTTLKRRGSCSRGTFTIFPAIYRISGKHIMRSGKRFGWCVYLYSVKSWQMYQYRLFNCSSCEALLRPLISWFKKLIAFMHAYSSLLTFSWWNLWYR